MWAISKVKVMALWCLCAAVAVSRYAMNRGAVLSGTDLKNLSNGHTNFVLQNKRNKKWLIEFNKGPEHNQYIHRI